MEFEIMVEVEGLTELTLIRVAEGKSGRALVMAAAEKGGFDGSHAFLFLEDADEALEIAEVVIDEEAARKIHHVHRSPHIDTTVHYKEGSKHRQFRPSTRVQRVLDWAVGPDGFNIDRAVAPEMELAIHGTMTALPKSAHIGRYARHEHKLELDLIRGVIPNGSGQ